MLKSVEGVYRKGKIELLEKLDNVDEAKVIVTFIPAKGRIDLRDKGIDKAHAYNLRGRLKTFAEYWAQPEMAVYDAL